MTNKNHSYFFIQKIQEYSQIFYTKLNSLTQNFRSRKVITFQ